jgi:phage tail-like protein
MPPTRNRPSSGFSILVEIDGVGSVFTEVESLGSESEVVEALEGGLNLEGGLKLPGRVRFPNVTLRRGLTSDRTLWDWRQAVVEGGSYRREVVIALLDAAGRPFLRWRLHGAWPAKWELAELDASKNELAIETVELAHDGLELEP